MHRRRSNGGTSAVTRTTKCSASSSPFSKTSSAERADRTEQPVHAELGLAQPVVWAGGEEERVRGPRGAVVPERERPEAVHHNRLPVRVVQRPVVRPARAVPPERVDPAVAEVADEQVAAEAAEGPRCERYAPRRVQHTAMRHTRDETALAVELV